MNDSIMDTDDTLFEVGRRLKYLSYYRLSVMSGLSTILGKTAFRLIEIVRMSYDTSIKMSRRDWSELLSPGHLSRFFLEPLF